MDGSVGFASMFDQLTYKPALNEFNILCIGETGLGKSILMESQFNTNFESTPSTQNLPNVKLNAHTYELQDSDVQLKLTLIETVGYNDQINNEDSLKHIVDYIDTQFEYYLQEELKVKSSLSTYHDTRVHCCLYFICPIKYGLKPIDLVCMKKLDTKVNVIPIIAKAGMFSTYDLEKFKTNINTELHLNGIEIYQCPTKNSHIPFGLVSSPSFATPGNKMRNPCGTVQVENELYCNFFKLRETLIRTNMEDLREKTHEKHYELYRKMRWEQMGINDVDYKNKPLSYQEFIEAKQNNYLQEFPNRINEALVVLKKKEESEFKEAKKMFAAEFEKLKLDHDDQKEKLDELLSQKKKKT